MRPGNPRERQHRMTCCSVSLWETMREASEAAAERTAIARCRSRGRRRASPCREIALRCERAERRGPVGTSPVKRTRGRRQRQPAVQRRRGESYPPAGMAAEQGGSGRGGTTDGKRLHRSWRTARPRRTEAYPTLLAFRVFSSFALTTDRRSASHAHELYWLGRPTSRQFRRLDSTSSDTSSSKSDRSLMGRPQQTSARSRLTARTGTSVAAQAEPPRRR